MTMAGMENNQRNQKTKTLGHLPIEKVQTMKEWTPYKTATQQFSKAKETAAQTKRAVRDALKQRLGLKADHIDFAEEDGGIRVFEALQTKKGRAGSVDLSDQFR
jgi:hypothetical protein